MISIDFEKLGALKNAGELACDAAKANQVEGAVNWGDLHCVLSKWSIDNYGHTYYSILIEKVSPNADKFRAFVEEYLVALGWNGIVVELEW